MCNFAPPDMVGHTGVYEPTVRACAATDRAVQKVRCVAACGCVFLLWSFLWVSCLELSFVCLVFVFAVRALMLMSCVTFLIHGTVCLLLFALRRENMVFASPKHSLCKSLALPLHSHALLTFPTSFRAPHTRPPHR